MFKCLLIQCSQLLKGQMATGNENHILSIIGYPDLFSLEKIPSRDEGEFSDHLSQLHNCIKW